MSENPYQVPAEVVGDQRVDEGEGQQPKDVATMRLYVSWWVVGLANMILPLTLGVAIGGYVAASAAVPTATVMMIASTLLIRRFPVLGRMTTAGGVLVALSQLFPIAQMCAGLAAIFVVEAIGLPGIDTLESKGGVDYPVAFLMLSFVVITMITGSLLALLATTIGAFFRLITPRELWVRDGILRV
jgi:hypothetical protein